MEQIHKKNHYVPRGYLKNWQDSEGKVAVYRTLVERSDIPLWRKRSVAAVAYQNHLYTRVVASKESDEVEQWFDKNFESPSMPVIKKVINNDRLSVEDWRILIRFLAAQDVRTPFRMIEHIKRFQEFIPETLAEIMKNLPQRMVESKISGIALDSNKNSSLLPLKVTSELVAGADQGFIKAETYVGRASWIFGMKHLLEKTINILYSHKWTIVAPAEGYDWFTSDNPVVKLNYQTADQYDLHGGWGVKNGNIFFPLGPKHAMFVQIGCYPPKRGSRLDVDLTRAMRKFSAENAYRYVFSNKFDPEISHIRERTVDQESLRREREMFSAWHEENAQQEVEFFRENK